MPWLLYRYIVLDLLRIIGLTTVVLVTVIAFGATIKPLTRHGLDAVQTAKYLMLAIVPMLQFALPFAAGFGATLSFYRMTADNEIQAMAASGISYRRILVPVAGLGIAITILMVVLTQAVIPRFWAMIVQTITTDMTKLFQAAIERGEAFQLERFQIYADHLFVKQNPEGADGPQTRMVLRHVAAADMDSTGKIITDVTAWQAVVDIYRRQGQTYLKMVMDDTVALNASTGHLVQSERIAPPRALTVPNSLSINPKGMTRAQLLELRHNPDTYHDVVRAKQDLVQVLQEIELRQTIDTRLRDEKRLDLEHDRIADSSEALLHRRYSVNAERLHNDGRFGAARNQPIEIVQFDSGVATLRFLADLAQLAPSANGAFSRPLFDLVLGPHDVVNLQQESGSVNRRGRLVIPNLALADLAHQDLQGASSDELIARAETSGRDRLRPFAAKVKDQIRKLQNEITGRLANRYALSVTAFLLLMLGTTMAIWLRGSLPLATYAWAFLPAVADLILISAGEQLIRDGYQWGHVLMWSGNALLMGILAVVYFRVSRN